MEAQLGKCTLTEATTTKVYEAIIKGDAKSINEMDKKILNCSIIEISCCLDQSPLHIAVNVGRLEMVKCLLKVKPSMCLANDRDGRNPLQRAAIEGHVNMLEVLHKQNPHAVKLRTNHNVGETVVHLCIKHNQLESLKTLVALSNKDGIQILNSKDNNGDTALHLAVASKLPEMVQYLLEQRGIEKNAINKEDMTALNIYKRQKRDDWRDVEMEKALNQGETKPAKYALHKQLDEKWLEEQRTSLMVVASLIATMAFQVGINPPGGVWQDDNSHEAGFSVWSSPRSQGWKQGFQHAAYNHVLVWNAAIALITSLSVILFLINGLPCKRQYFLFILRITLWISVTATAYTYLNSVGALTSDHNKKFWLLLGNCIRIWLVIVGIVFLGNVCRFIWKLQGWQRKDSIKQLGNKCFTRCSPQTAATTTTTTDCCC